MNAVIVSAALDTNGQNARFVRAADKHGHKVIHAFAIGNSDPAGVVARFQAAAQKGDRLRIRSAHKQTAYFEFPTDLVWDHHNHDQIYRLIREADVVHLNNSYRAVQQFRLSQPMLLHHHGSLFRANPTAMLSMAASRRMVSAVSTVDLLRPAPGVLRWLPSAYDVSALEAFGQSHRRPADGRILVAHAPTNRTLKHTQVLLSAVSALAAEGLPIDLDVIEGVTNAECLGRKAKADIVFDQLAYGYGCNSIEAWAMGVPVISGSDQWTDAKMRDMWGDVPYALASESSLKEVLRGLVLSADMRAEYAARGMQHVRRYHDELPALERLAELYAEAIRTFVGHRTVVQPVRFKGPRDTSLHVLGETVSFAQGEVVVDHPDVIKRLRYLSTRPTFGITELG